VAFASSLDKIGPFATNVSDAAAVLSVVAGHDPNDSTSAAVPVTDYLGSIGQSVAGLRIGVPEDYFGEGLDAEVRGKVDAAIAALEKLGCKRIPLHMPHTDYAIAAYYIIATAEASSNLARYDGVRYGLRVSDGTLGEMYRKTRGRGFGPEVKRRIMLGTYALSSGYYDAYYLRAQKVRSLIARDFADAFQKVDVIVTPTAPTPAFKLGEKSADPLQMYLADIYTVTGSLAGVPGISVPCGETKAGLPVGLQIFGKHFDEARVLQVARAYEIASGEL
ncbi:MAG TPA: amidase family protein, partial [Candidatus Acidoferrales bacterium]